MVEFRDFFVYFVQIQTLFSIISILSFIYKFESSAYL